MLTLQTLGSVNLVGLDGMELTAILSQPKRYAILVYLALARGGDLVHRDSLLALFWPEQDEAHARNALGQSLHYLRRNLPGEVITGRGKERVGVNPRSIRVDVNDFNCALAEGRWAEALDLYGGDFLEGLHVGDAPGFEEWMAGERERLREAAAAASWSQAWEHLERGALVEAERIAQLATELVCTDESPVRSFIEALAHAGDRAAALNFYERFSARLGKKLDLDPSRETQEVVKSLRNGALAGDPDQVGDLVNDSGLGAGHAFGPGAGNSPVKAFRSSEQASAVKREPAPQPRRPRRHLILLWAALALGGGTVSALWVSGNPSTDIPPGERDLRPTIAVLPFENRSPNPSDAFFAEGMQGQILSRLSDISSLRVISHTSVMGYEEERPSVPRIVEELGVDFLVDGSAQLAGDRIRLIVQLMDARRGETLWSEDFYLGLSAKTLFEMEDSVAQQIAFTVGVNLTPWERDKVARALTDNTDAYLLFLQGKDEFLRERRGLIGDDFPSIGLFDRAVELDPDFALGHAYLALSLSYTHPDEQRFERAKQEAELALSILPELGEARVALGRYFLWAGQGQEAMRHFRAAETEDPNLALAALELGSLQRRMGKFEAGLRSLERAEKLDPRNPTVLWNLEASYIHQHRYDDALRTSQSYGEGSPFSAATVHRAFLYLLRGEEEEARTTISALFGSRPSSFYDFTPGAPWAVIRTLLPPEQRRVALDALLDRREIPVNPRTHELLQIATHEEEVGSKETARVYWDSLAMAMKDHPPQSWWEYAAMPLIYQGLGEKGAAIGAAETLISLDGAWREGMEDDRFDWGWRARALLARILAHFGEPDRAIDLLEELLPAPSWLSVPMLEIDPIWDPLRSHPRFQALLDKYRDDVER